MNAQSNTTSNSLIGSPHEAQPVDRSVSEGPALPTVADRVYQIAALTAGIFLLATLL